MSATAVSDWPTPTVSTTITSKPARLAGQHRLPRAPGNAAQGVAGGRGADERLRRAGQLLHPVLSPRIEPPLRAEVGSTASTAMRWPRSITWRPERLDGGRLAHARHAGDAEPDRAAGRRQELLQAAPGRRRGWSGRVDSISVIARARSRRRPAFSPSASACGSAVLAPGSGMAGALGLLTGRSGGIMTHGGTEAQRGPGADGGRLPTGRERRRFPPLRGGLLAGCLLAGCPIEARRQIEVRVSSVISVPLWLAGNSGLARGAAKRVRVRK